MGNAKLQALEREGKANLHGLRTWLPLAQTDDRSLDGGKVDLAVGQGEAVEDRLGVDGDPSQIAAVLAC